MTETGDIPHRPAGDTLRTSPWRLPTQPGEWIDRQRPLQFQFEGRVYSGFAGDTISSALAANGVRLLGRSFKYHRPRGIYSMANHDVNVLVSDGTRTNIRADVTPVWDGAELTAVNTFGGLENDQARRFDKIGRFLPVGFYYKTFHKPKRLFPFWERQMRAMAGLGAVDPKAPRLRTAKRYDWCDLLVVGGGASGLSAAIAAAGQGLQVIVVDEQPYAGGSLCYQRTDDAAVLKSLLDGAAALTNLSLRTSTVAAGYYADHWLALVDEHRLTKVRARSLVFATGAFEQPALFRNNDSPGVMLASAAQRLIRLFSVKPFARPVVLAANSDGYWAALELARAGIDVRMIVDLRPGGEPTDVRLAVAHAGIAIQTGHSVYEAISGSDAIGVEAVLVCPFEGEGQPQAKAAERIECDGLVMSIGWAPADSLFCQAGGKMKYSRELEQFLPEFLPPGIFVAGRLKGVFDVDAKVADGRRAGLEAAAQLGHYSGALPAAIARPSTSPSHAYPVVDHPAGKVFVDLDEDVQLKDIIHAVQEGFDNVELLKRYSTFGMGPSQGKIANTNTIRVLARERGESMGETGSPTARPFFHPVPLSHLAGKGLHPHRETALHSHHEALGAVFMPAGDWLRPAYYESSAGGGESVGNALRGVPQRPALPSGQQPRNTTERVSYRLRELAIAAEVAAVRERAGLIDVSTLGKLEITGPDAAEFLERIYTGRFAKMKIGTTRYGLMCDETGVIIDDGVIGRLADDRFYVTTTTTASGSVYREMQRWAIIWKHKVVLANLTGPVAAMNLAGPEAPAILGELCDLDLSEAGFPYLGLRETTVFDVPARVLRTGFVGEVGYEIHVPARSAPRIWDAILTTGASRGIMPFGVEAQRVLRLEKGHVIVSQDTDGLTTPLEVGMEWAVRHDKPFFVGGRSLQIVARKPLKRRLVGFTLPRGYIGPLPRECHLVIEKNEIVGRVTSIADSATLGQPIGLAYVAPHQAAEGSEIQIRIEGGKLVTAMVVELPFYDRQNARQRVAGWTRRSSDRRPGASEVSGVGHQVSVAGGNSDELSITDLSHLDRVVLKGPAAAELLAQHGIDVPKKLYEYRSLADDGFIVRTGATEFFLEVAEYPGTVSRLRAALDRHQPGLLPVWRQDVSLVISGSKSTELLSQLASFNFRDAGEIFVMTLVAGVSCSVLARQRNGRPSWQIWADGSYGGYLSEAFEAVKQRSPR